MKSPTIVTHEWKVWEGVLGRGTSGFCSTDAWWGRSLWSAPEGLLECGGGEHAGGREDGAVLVQPSEKQMGLDV